ncbi:hypothetical protein, conserved [Angomonas deanei]|uniref:Uncharacterized protein n=1 Tax=Angomonas deanei TaxID=59799 RepID=A0A7G2CIZ0_9TRYP|nr:hypothetical protein, conserved [Angomonas deanei]
MSSSLQAVLLCSLLLLTAVTGHSLVGWVDVSLQHHATPKQEWKDLYKNFIVHVLNEKDTVVKSAVLDPTFTFDFVNWDNNNNNNNENKAYAVKLDLQFPDNFPYTIDEAASKLIYKTTTGESNNKKVELKVVLAEQKARAAVSVDQEAGESVVGRLVSSVLLLGAIAGLLYYMDRVVYFFDFPFLRMPKQQKVMVAQTRKH